MGNLKTKFPGTTAILEEEVIRAARREVYRAARAELRPLLPEAEVSKLAARIALNVSKALEE